MVERIRLILKTKNLSASTFADEIGVQRSAISHILSGRNNPSLEFIQKILRRYPELNTEWVISGKGEMVSYNLFNSNEDAIQKLKEIKLRKENNQVATISNSDNYNELSNFEKSSTDLELNIQDVQGKSEVISKPEKVRIIEQKIQNSPIIETKKSIASSKVENKDSNNKKVERIVIFYSDKTFKEFSPDD